VRCRIARNGRCKREGGTKHPWRKS
jgi:hypothetical protein